LTVLTLLLVGFSPAQDEKKDKVDPAPAADKVPVFHGWKLSRLPDKKKGFQKYFAPAKFKTTASAMAWDLRAKFPAVYNQGPLGSCVANGVASAYQFKAMWQANANIFTPSRLFDYYYTRLIEGTVGSDSGSSIEDGVAAVAKYGTVPESQWPYDVSKFKQKPPQTMAQSMPNAISDYARCPDNSAPDICAAITSGNPVIIGFDVYSNFPNGASTGGVVPMPAGSIEGGHCVVLVGYDFDGSLGHKGYYIFRNSWDVTWGDKGYGYFPRAFIESNKYSSDYWIIASVPGGKDPGPTPPPQPSMIDVGINISAKTVSVPAGWKAYRGPARQTWVTTDPPSSSVTVPSGWRVVGPHADGLKGLPWLDILAKVEELLKEFGPAAVPIINALIDSTPLPAFVKWEVEALIASYLAQNKKAG
jgi:hypothetical protein